MSLLDIAHKNEIDLEGMLSLRTAHLLPAHVHATVCCALCAMCACVSCILCVSLFSVFLRVREGALVCSACVQGESLVSHHILSLSLSLLFSLSLSRSHLSHRCHVIIKDPKV